MKKLVFFLFFTVSFLPQRVFSDNMIFPHLTQGDLSSAAAVPSLVIIHDSTNVYWTIFSSNFYGFQEFWVAYSQDTKQWSRPLYTGIPVLPTDNYHIRVKKHQIDFDWFGELDTPSEKRYYRAYIDTTITGYTIHKYMLYTDSDADGLSDLAEDVLWTDPLEWDSDGDGRMDGYDQNPLAAPLDNLSLAARLHKSIIEYELEEFYSNQLVIVEQYKNTPMEYDRYEGLVLSLSSNACDVYVSEFGYGVPILTCTVNDSTTNYLSASFQFFISPSNAWGYDFICQWDDALKEFVNFDVTNEWIAE